MNCSDFLKTRIVNRSGLITIFLFLFVSISLLPAINNTHAQCTGPIEDCFDETAYYWPQITDSPKDPFCKKETFVNINCSYSYWFALYPEAGLCPTEITIGSTCDIASSSVKDGQGIEYMLTAEVDAMTTEKVRAGIIPVIVDVGFSGVGTGTFTITAYCKPCDDIVIDTDTTTDNHSDGKIYDPVSTFTGELFDVYEHDLNPGGPMPLFFSRYYASNLKLSGATGNMGDNWLHNFEWSLTVTGPYPIITSHKGRRITFSDNGSSWDLTGTTDIPFQFVESGRDYVLYNPHTGSMYTFDSTGKLTRIEDGRGNTHTLTYSGTTLTQVTDGLGRTISFNYSGNKLDSVTDGTRTVTFAYTGDDLTGVTDARGNTTQYTYDTGGLMTAKDLPENNSPYTHNYNADGKVTSQSDALGNTNTIAYDTPIETITTMTDPLGNTRRHAHSSNGEITANQREDDLYTILGYDNDGRRTSVTDLMGDTTAYTYHAASGKLAGVTNADSTTTTYAYTLRTHSSGIKFYDLTGITYPDTTTEAFVYDTSGNVTSRNDRGGQVWTFTYNSRGQMLTATNPSGGVHTNTYNSDGTPATSKDAFNNTTTYAYDSFKRLVTITHADATTRTFTYDNNDNLLTAKDEGGNTTTFTYDDNNNLATMKDRLNKTTTFAYDAMDRVTSVRDPLGNSTGLTYDELERLKTSTDRNGNVTTLGYDARGRLTSITDGDSKIWAKTYDAESIIASSTDPLSNTANFTSDKMGRITQVTSPLTYATNITYDSMGRVASVKNPLLETTINTYDARGLLTGISIPESISASYTRNALGLVTNITDPNSNAWQRAYDNQGRITSRTDPLSNVTSYTYDTRNRVSRVTSPASTLDFTYDGISNVTRRLYSDATDIAYTYDNEGRLTSANSLTLTYDDNGRITNSNGMALTRDDGGRIATVTLASGKAVTYAYNSRNLLTSITDWLTDVTSLTYDDADRLTTITRPNGVTTTYTYDNDSRLTDIQDGSLSSITLTRDGKGQITAAARALPLEHTLTNSTTTLTYDAASQIASNTFDNMGRLTDDDTRTYIWDLASRLTSYTEGGNTITFTYDALGNRTSRTEGGVTRSYMWNYALGIPSITVEMQGGSDLRYYIHTPGGSLLYSIEATGSTRRDYHYDEMGNTIFLTNDVGAVIGSYAYTPFGELTASTGGLDNPFTWQGQFGIIDEASGLYYVRARYYDANTGRFVSRDPIKSISPRTINPYQYALGNPLRFVDVTGTAPTTVEQAQAEAEAAYAAYVAAITADYAAVAAVAAADADAADADARANDADARANDAYDAYNALRTAADFAAVFANIFALNNDGPDNDGPDNDGHKTGLTGTSNWTEEDWEKWMYGLMPDTSYRSSNPNNCPQDGNDSAK